jgi:hypothetical protein
MFDLILGDRCEEKLMVPEKSAEPFNFKRRIPQRAGSKIRSKKSTATASVLPTSGGEGLSTTVAQLAGISAGTL